MLHATFFDSFERFLHSFFVHSSVPEMLNLTGFPGNPSQDSSLPVLQRVAPPLQHLQPPSALLFSHQDVGGRARPPLGLQTPVRHA